MPSRGKHKQFDKYLAERHVLLSEAEYDKLHEFMDRGVGLYGSEHRERDVFHAEEGLRSWINGKYNVIGQDLATDWLRAGLGHISLDEMERALDDDYDWHEVFDSAYRSMAQRGWIRARFVAR